MKDEKYWYQEWKNAAERSTFSEIYPQADLCWDHAASTYDLGMGNSLERVDVVLEELKKMGYSRDTLQSVLDVGSGTGTYTLPFAHIYKKVTAIDCSLEMNNCLRKKAEKTGRDITIITDDFMDHLFTNTYDLVFASMNPGTYRPDAFEKMLSLTKKVLIYVGIIPRPAISSERRSLEEILFDVKLTHGGSNDVKYPYELLKAKGYHPYIREAACRWEYMEDVELAIQRKKDLYEKVPQHHKNWKGELENYIQSQVVDGQIVQKGDSQLGIVICNVEEKIEK